MKANGADRNIYDWALWWLLRTIKKEKYTYYSDGDMHDLWNGFKAALKWNRQYHEALPESIETLNRILDLMEWLENQE